MDKASERKLDAKKRDGSDIDQGVHTFGPGNKIERLESMCCHASEEVVGLGLDRLLTNNYLKKELRPKNDRPVDKLVAAAEALATRDDPPLNISKAKIVDEW